MGARDPHSLVDLALSRHGSFVVEELAYLPKETTEPVRKILSKNLEAICERRNS